MKEFLYSIVYYIAAIHDQVLTLNDAYEYNFSDKELHFLIVGVFGLLLVFIVHPIFKAFAKRGHIMPITWIYVFTFLLFFTFAIEIGQQLTGTGRMELEDVVSGMGGFLLMFFIYNTLRLLVKETIRLFKRHKD